MSNKTSIEWTRGDDGTPGATWNPVTGCEKVSPGCDNCYALTFAERWRGTPGHYFEHGFDVQLRPGKLDLPLRWRKPRRIFVNSMSDLFHKDIPDEYIAQVFAVMALARRHTFQVLTKRHGRMRSLLNDGRWCMSVGMAMEEIRPYSLNEFEQQPMFPLPNVWLGVSVENQQWADIRIPALLDTPAAVRFLSCEPLLGGVDLADWMPPGFARWQCWYCRRFFFGAHHAACPRCGEVGGWCGSHIGNSKPNGQPIDWVIVGGESGPGARPMHPGWARSLRDQCADAGVPFLFKQAGSVLAREWGGTGKGGDPATWPEPFAREFPAVAL